MILGCADFEESATNNRACWGSDVTSPMKECQSVGRALPERLLHGFSTVGDIERSQRWPIFEKAQEVTPIEKVLPRAWQIRKKIVSRDSALPVSDNLRAIWDATIENVKEFSSVGPFVAEEEVTIFLKVEVVQNDKVRGCDSATSNMINPTTKISEKLQLPFTDLNVSVIRELRTSVADRQIGGWSWMRGKPAGR